jgi:hypothetical protein
MNRTRGERDQVVIELCQHALDVGIAQARVDLR